MLQLVVEVKRVVVKEVIKVVIRVKDVNVMLLLDLPVKNVHWVRNRVRNRVRVWDLAGVRNGGILPSCYFSLKKKKICLLYGLYHVG